jgi:hypothetical protein
MKYNKSSRRHFLQGAGGSLLALPFLPSLMSKAEAQTLPAQKYLVIFTSGHGGIYASNMYPLRNHPTVAGQLTQTALYPGQGHNAVAGLLRNLKTTRASNLAYFASSLGHGTNQPHAYEGVDGYGLNPALQDLDNGVARVSPILGSFISDAMLNKINLIAGLDMISDAGHTRGLTGNFANRDGGMSPNVHISTIDRVVANYAGFYGSASPIARSMVFNNHWEGADMINQNLSADWNGSALVANSHQPTTLGQAFNMLFGSLTVPANTQGKKTFLLNSVYADYERVARGAYGPGRRISSEDRNRFEEFMSNLDGIIRSLGGGGAVCLPPSVSSSDQRYLRGGGFSIPINLSTNQTILDLENQMITAAFACGRTNIFMVCLPSLRDQFIANGLPGQTFSDQGQSGPGGTIDNIDAHQGMFHQHKLPSRQRHLTDSARWYFQHSFYNLMQKLEAVSSPAGGTMLDRSLLFWTQESGHKTHDGWTLPVITAGSAGGYFRTGQYVDYRATNRIIDYYEPQSYQGLAYNRFLATVLQSMGVPPSAYEVAASRFAGSTGRIPTSSRGTVLGYGHPNQGRWGLVGTAGTGFQYDYQLNDLSVSLPIIT